MVPLKLIKYNAREVYTSHTYCHAAKELLLCVSLPLFLIHATWLSDFFPGSHLTWLILVLIPIWFLSTNGTYQKDAIYFCQCYMISENLQWLRDPFLHNQVIETVVVLKQSNYHVAEKVVQCHVTYHSYFLLTLKGILTLSYLCISMLQELFPYVSTFLLTQNRKLLPIFCVFVCLCIYQLLCYIISQPKLDHNNKTKLKQQTSIISQDSLVIWGVILIWVNLADLCKQLKHMV